MSGKAAGGVRKEQAERTRLALLEATVHCLCEHGYAATTTAKVVALAGLTRGAALHHFDSKIDLIVETARHIIQVQNEFRRSRRSGSADPHTRLIETLDIVWSSWKQPHALALLEIDIAARGDPELEHRYRPIRTEIRQSQFGAYSRIAGEAGFTDEPFNRALMVLTVSAMRGLTLERLMMKNDKEVDAAMQLLKQMRSALLDRGRNAGEPEGHSTEA